MDEATRKFVEAALSTAPPFKGTNVEESWAERAELELSKPLCFQGEPPRTLGEVPAHLEKVRSMFAYEAETGRLIYTYQPPDSFHRFATRPGPNGHGRVKLYNLTTASAHVVWLLHHGRWPVGRLKRRDDDPRNDRIENLYEPQAEVQKAPRREPSRGVARLGADHWQAYVRRNGVQKNLGRFKTEAEAIAARKAWDDGIDLV